MVLTKPLPGSVMICKKSKNKVNHEQCILLGDICSEYSDNLVNIPNEYMTKKHPNNIKLLSLKIMKISTEKVLAVLYKLWKSFAIFYDKDLLTY